MARSRGKAAVCRGQVVTDGGKAKVGWEKTTGKLQSVSNVLVFGEDDGIMDKNTYNWLITYIFVLSSIKF